ncbi:MAG: lysophospholipid acyltransferase family protein [Verrucomicrobiota bacterium]
MGNPHPIRARFEVLGVRLGFVFIPLMPRCTVLALARFVGAGIYTCSGRNRRVGLANLDIAFGDTKTPTEKKKILRRSIQHFTLSLLDLFWFMRHQAERLDRYFISEAAYEHVYLPGARLVVTAHIGNWELMGIQAALGGIPIMGVAAPLKNPKVDEYFQRARKSTGQVIIPQQGAIRQLLKGLREGKTVAVLLDQNTRPRDGGVFIEMFGLPVPISIAPAAMALKTGSEIILVYSRPDGSGNYTNCSLGLVEIKDDDDPVSLTMRMTAAYETAIREYPEMWFWPYKRWKLMPEGETKPPYPFYARALRDSDLS